MPAPTPDFVLGYRAVMLDGLAHDAQILQERGVIGSGGATAHLWNADGSKDCDDHNHEDQLDQAPGNEAEQELVEHRQIRRDVIDAQREALADMRDRSAIDDDVLRKIERDLDLEELRMEA